jgi:lysophospholipase L1-like esterase
MEGLLLGFAAIYPRLRPYVTWGGPEADNREGLQYVGLREVFDFGSGGAPARTDSVVENLYAQRDQAAVTDPGTEASEASTPKLRKARDTTRHPKLVNPGELGQGSELDAFFQALAALEHQGVDELFRIAHYGDSQIEGDRISRFLRDSLQKRFGGNGMGYIPFQEPAERFRINREREGFWRRMTFFQNKYAAERYGPSGAVFKIDPPDSLPDPPPPPYTSRCRFSWSEAVTFDRAKLLYGQSDGPWRLRTALGDTLFRDTTIRRSSAFNILPLQVTAADGQLDVEIQAKRSPELYGLMLDPDTGLQVDNFGMRGSSGYGHLHMKKPLIAEELQRLNYRLIILQFGGNVVPYADELDWAYFEHATYSTIRRLQDACPNASIMVVSVSDQARKVKGEYRSYPTIPRLRSVQLRAAKRAGVAFFDLYKAMGGPGSIISWVRHKPALAGYDYAHFTRAGQRLVANLLLRRLIGTYEDYRVAKGLVEPSAPASDGQASEASPTDTNRADTARDTITP